MGCSRIKLGYKKRNNAFLGVGINTNINSEIFPNSLEVGGLEVGPVLPSFVYKEYCKVL